MNGLLRFNDGLVKWRVLAFIADFVLPHDAAAFGELKNVRGLLAEVAGPALLCRSGEAKHPACAPARPQFMAARKAAIEMRTAPAAGENA